MIFFRVQSPPPALNMSAIHMCFLTQNKYLPSTANSVSNA